MRLRRLSSLFTLFALVLSSGCCWCDHWREHRCCRRPFRDRGDSDCPSCSASMYTPACDCGIPAGPPMMAPMPIAGPMIKTSTLTTSH